MILKKIVNLGKTDEQKTRIANVLFWTIFPIMIILHSIYYLLQVVIELIKILVFIIEDLLSIIILDFHYKWFFSQIKSRCTDIHYNIREKRGLN